MYNQCANIVLKYAIKKHAGHREAPPLDVTEKEELPPPPAPGQIDCIVAGFPWCVSSISTVLPLLTSMGVYQPAAFDSEHVSEGA